MSGRARSVRLLSRRRSLLAAGHRANTRPPRTCVRSPIRKHGRTMAGGRKQSCEIHPRNTLLADCRAGGTGSGLAFCIGNLVVRGLGATRQEREDLLRRAGSRFTPEAITPGAWLLSRNTSSAADGGRADACGRGRSQPDRPRGGQGPRSCVGTRMGNRDRRAALRLPAARRSAVCPPARVSRVRL